MTPYLETAAWAMLLAPIAVGTYAYIGYPGLVALLAWLRPAAPLPSGQPSEWPTISVSLPAHNEEDVIRGTLETILQADYPDDRLEVIVVSDASTDGTDRIVREFSDRGVRLLRLDERTGKTGAENAALSHLSGEIVVNTDASTRIGPASLKALARTFQDESIGVASGRDVAVADDASAAAGEKNYTGYEMRLRSLETRYDSIVGASGCLYAIRKDLHVAEEFPPETSRDFGAALVAREHGYRAVSVDEARAVVPLTSSLRREYQRKKRTLLRGLRTLMYKRHLLNPLRHGSFSFMLFSHKLCRWLVPLLAPLGLLGLSILAFEHAWAGWCLSLAGMTAGAAAWAVYADDAPSLPRPLSFIGFALAANLAAGLAWIQWLGDAQSAVWNPTDRPGVLE